MEGHRKTGIVLSLVDMLSMLNRKNKNDMAGCVKFVNYPVGANPQRKLTFVITCQTELSPIEQLNR